jgi:ParB-like chromosome segregation protein Spo0J
MTLRDQLKVHPAADIFPLIEGAEFDALVADIAAHGVREPITLHDGKILDGRNRHRAALKAGRTCPTRPFEENDPLAFVISLNLKRRQLTSSQLAFVALEIERVEAELAKKRMVQGGGDKKSGVAQMPPPIKDQGKARDKAAGRWHHSCGSQKTWSSFYWL